MKTVPQSLYIGGTFRMKGRIKDLCDKTYVSFTGAEFNFYVRDDKGVSVPELFASSTGATPEITLESNDTVFDVNIPPEKTELVDFLYGEYALWIKWPSGDEVPLVTGTLTPYSIVKS